jgi:DNA-binding MarR family transcriptional regulator
MPKSPNIGTWEIREFLTYRLNILYRLLDRQTTKILVDKFGLSLAEWRVLSRLAANSPMTVRKIAAIIYLDKAQISRAAASLIRRGYAVRNEDPTDGRSTSFSITSEGRKRYQTMLRVSRNRNRDLLKQLGSSQRRDLFEAIAKLTDYLRPTKVNGDRREPK